MRKQRDIKNSNKRGHKPMELFKMRKDEITKQEIKTKGDTSLRNIS